MDKQDVRDNGGRLPFHDKAGRVVKNIKKQHIEQVIDTQDYDKARRKAQVAAQYKASAARKALPQGKRSIGAFVFCAQVRPRVAKGHAGHQKKELTAHLPVIDELPKPCHILHDKMAVVHHDNHQDTNAF